MVFHWDGRKGGRECQVCVLSEATGRGKVLKRGLLRWHHHEAVPLLTFKIKILKGGRREMKVMNILVF